VTKILEWLPGENKMDNLWQDIRYGLRTLVRNPSFTVVAIVVLALGIGANTAIFTVVNAVLLRPLPFNQPDRLVRVWPQKLDTSVSKAEFVELKEQNHSFADLAGYSGWSFTLTGRDEPAKVEGARTTASFFSLLGSTATLGRTFLPDEDLPGHSSVAILSYGSWQSRFGADRNILGHSIVVDGESRTIVGVLPRSFKFPDNGFSKLDVELVVPAELAPGNRNDFTAGYLSLIGRLNPNVSAEQAQAEVSSIARNSRTKLSIPTDSYGLEAAVQPLQKELVGETRLLLVVLLGAVGLVLLIACANVANLQLARTTARKREIATRAALGASRGRIVRQLLTESVALATLGGLVGVPLALWGIDLLVALLPAEMPRLNEIHMDWRVLSFSFGISLLTGMLFGLAPALQGAMVDLHTTLKEGGRGISGPRGRLRSVLVVTEVALTLILVVGAGLLIKSFWRLRQVDPGFKAENVLSLQLAPPETSYSEDSRKRTFYRQIEERIQQIPGVNTVGAIHLLPMGGNNWNPGLRVEDQPSPAGATLPHVDWRLITPGYFRAMGTPLISGRWFTDSDNENSPGVTIVNQTLAKRYWPGQDPIGKRIRGGFEGKQWVTIVGVVGDVKEQRLDLPTHLEMYRPYPQAPFPSSMVLMVRANSDPVALAAAVRREVWSVDKDVPVADVQPMTAVLSESFASRRATMLLLVAFAGLAVLLAAVGVYGIVTYAVSQRTHEIGIRIALGATSKDVLRLIVGQGLRLVFIGLALGVVGAYLTTRVLESFLFGISATDPLTFAATIVLFAGIGLLACLVPALRALSVDPLVALRCE
jgi:putative ABC transport system permease protein